MTRHPTKLVIHNLPINLTEYDFTQLIQSIQQYINWVYYVQGKQRNTVTSTRLSTAYINVVQYDNVITVVKLLQTIDFGSTIHIEYALYQAIPRKKQQIDSLCNTYESDTVYTEFVKQLEQQYDILPSAEKQLEQRTATNTTPHNNRTAAIIEYMIDTMKQTKQAKQQAKRDNKKFKLSATIDENELYDSDNNDTNNNNKSTKSSKSQSKQHKSKAVLITDEKQAQKARKQQKRIEQRLKKLQQKAEKKANTENTADTPSEKKQYKIKKKEKLNDRNATADHVPVSNMPQHNNTESKPIIQPYKPKPVPTTDNTNNSTTVPSTTTPSKAELKKQRHKSKNKSHNENKPVFVAKSKPNSDVNTT